jgi:GTPase SAR1 family protein
VLLVFDITNRQSWKDMLLWEKEVAQRVPTAQIVIIGNKVDLEQERVIAHHVAHRWARQHRYGYVETSCVTGAGVDDLFVGVAHLVAGL